MRADSTVAGNIPIDPLVGRTLDEKYRLDERLGTGGMGTVYRATHLLIDRPVAVKLLNPRFVEDEAAQARFRREARAAGRLQHSNAVAVTDFGRTSDGYVYIVMELLEGRTLRDVLAREAPLDTARSVSMMLQISAAVAAAHEAGIIHRDLKPANIFIVQRKDAPPFVKVLDFGIAKLAAESIDDEDPKTLTAVGVMIGTPKYMSPEQCDGGPLSPASDVYSLGIILYEMLTGTTPFTGTSPLAIALKHSTEEPRPPREWVVTIPPAIEELVLKALEKNPLARPQNAAEFRRELYATAERLGLEHSANLSVPSLETLRSAGTETPSGRLVIDIGRLREQRALASSGGDGKAEAAATSEMKAARTQSIVKEPNVAAIAPVEDVAPVADVASVAAAPAASPARSTKPLDIARIRVFFEQKKPLLKQPRVLASVIALFFVIVVASALALRSSRAPSANTNAAIESAPTPSETASPQQATPSPESEASPDEHKTTNQSSRHEQSNKTVSNNQDKKNDKNILEKSADKLKSGAKKIKKIFKNPF
ncbi:MAG: eukaryotic-like serine/threonine-protein kinase [Blastocatellia bacterium]|nr:eukaryotic-like serine/threonine-protein kinase [Blastocatellia bacterium]